MRSRLTPEKVMVLRTVFQEGLSTLRASKVAECGWNTAQRYYQIFRGELLVKGRPRRPGHRQRGH